MAGLFAPRYLHCFYSFVFFLHFGASCTCQITLNAAHAYFFLLLFCLLAYSMQFYNPVEVLGLSFVTSVLLDRIDRLCRSFQKVESI